MLVTNAFIEVEPSGKIEVERIVVGMLDVINTLLEEREVSSDAEPEGPLEIADDVSMEALVELSTTLAPPVVVEVASGVELLEAGGSSELVLAGGGGSSVEVAK